MDDKNRGYEGRGPQGGFGHRTDTSLTESQTGTDTQGRSPDYEDDRLGDDRMGGRYAEGVASGGTGGTAAGRPESGVPASDAMRDEKLIDGRHATDLNPDGTPILGERGGAAGTARSHHELGDNRDGMGRDRTDQVAADETGKLISADKVIGTAVYNAAGDRLGTIHSVMLHKISGRVAYAVMSFGGFLGIGERYHPLPWDVLTYDEEKGGYNIDKTEDQLRGAPHYSREELERLDYGEKGAHIRDYYGVGSAGGSPGNSTSTSSAYELGRGAGGSAAYGTSTQGTTRPYGSPETKY